MKDNPNPTVYSTSQGRICPVCHNPIDKCKCKSISSNINVNKDGITRLSLDRKGRGGRVVTLISGLPLQLDQLRTLTKEIKQKCGTGGSIKNGKIEIQGDVRNEVFNLLIDKGLKVKIAGG